MPMISRASSCSETRIFPSVTGDLTAHHAGQHYTGKGRGKFKDNGIPYDLRNGGLWE